MNPCNDYNVSQQPSFKIVKFQNNVIKMTSEEKRAFCVMLQQQKHRLSFCLWIPWDHIAARGLLEEAYVLTKHASQPEVGGSSQLELVPSPSLCCCCCQVTDLPEIPGLGSYIVPGWYHWFVLPWHSWRYYILKVFFIFSYGEAL